MTPASPPKTFSPRLLRLLLLVVAAGVPAAGLRVLCAGNSCNQPATASATVPFCSLGSETRRLVAAGFRDGRSPEVLAVTGEGSVVDASLGGGARYGPAWPTATSADDAVPLVFWGTGVDPSAQLPPSTSLDAVAPTSQR